MPGKSPSQRIEELSGRLRDLEATFEQHRAVTDLKVQRLEAREAERTRTDDEFKNKIADLVARNATLEERSRNHEKTSDRGWNIGQAVVVSVISMIGGALLSLLAQLALKK